MRRRNRPQRRVAEETLVSRPADGAAVLLNPMTTLIWDALVDWQDKSGLLAELGRLFPEVSREERLRAMCEALDLLGEQELLEHVES